MATPLLQKVSDSSGATNRNALPFNPGDKCEFKLNNEKFKMHHSIEMSDKGDSVIHRQIVEWYDPVTKQMLRDISGKAYMIDTTDL